MMLVLYCAVLFRNLSNNRESIRGEESILVGFWLR